MELKTTEQSTEDLLGKAEDFLVKLNLMIKNLRNEDISRARKEFGRLLG